VGSTAVLLPSTAHQTPSTYVPELGPRACGWPVAGDCRALSTAVAGRLRAYQKYDYNIRQVSCLSPLSASSWALRDVNRRSRLAPEPPTSLPAVVLLETVLSER
jgi:hypothetical protein